MNSCKDHELGNVSAYEMKQSVQGKFGKEKDWVELNIEDIELIFESLEKLKIVRKILAKDNAGKFYDRFNLT